MEGRVYGNSTWTLLGGSPSAPSEVSPLSPGLWGIDVVLGTLVSSGTTAGPVTPVDGSLSIYLEGSGVRSPVGVPFGCRWV